MNAEDTIAAIATAPGEAGVSIVRVSGPDSLAIADRVFDCRGSKPSEKKPFTFVHGRVTDDEGAIDDALLLVMRAPHSYTTEDVIEIQGHGGNTNAQRILRRVLGEGARLASPGEFTKRAFLNGRIDLLQAEAVLDLIRARTDRAAKAAIEQLEGSLSDQFNQLYNRILEVAADVEATLDFPEDELPAPVMDDIVTRLGDARTAMGLLISTWDEGHMLRDGAIVVISGKPNVGKSTLLNGLLDTDRAIVSHVPGTTRDIIEEGLVVDGIPVRLLDTAGLRATSDLVEEEGIRRTRSHMKRADLHLYVIDASTPLDAEDLDHLSGLKKERAVVVLNKVDLGKQVLEEALQPLTAIPTVLTSGEGIDLVRSAIAGKLRSGLDLSAPPHAVIAERHRQLLVEADAALDTALEMLAKRQEDLAPLASTQLRSALERIGLVTGRTFESELLDSIFSRFCIGK